MGRRPTTKRHDAYIAHSSNMFVLLIVRNVLRSTFFVREGRNQKRAFAYAIRDTTMINSVWVILPQLRGGID